MKKFFMMLPLMVALVALVGCKKDSTKSTDPDTPDVPGEDLKENDPYYSSLNIIGCAIFGEPEMIPGTQTQIQISEEETVDAQLGKSLFIAWGSGVSYDDNQGTFTGKGFVIKSIVAVYFVTSGEYAGVYFSPENGFRVMASSDPEGVMTPGHIDPTTYGDWISYLNGEIETVDTTKIWSNTKGTFICMDDYTDTESYPETMLALYRGQINKMVINPGQNNAVTSWGADVTWSNMTSAIRMYGFQVDTAKMTLVKPYNYKSVNKKFNESVLNAAQSAPARAPRAFRSIADLRKPMALKK